MKIGDVKYVVDIDAEYSTLYKAIILRPHTRWKNNWVVKYKEVVIDFLNLPGSTLEGQNGVFDAETHIFDTIEGSIMSIINNNYGMLPENMIRKLFK